MTKFHRETLRCPHCLNEEEVVIWDSVDAQSDPDLKERILLKELQNYECQNCNHLYILEKPFAFIDRKEKLILYYNPEHGAIPELNLRQDNGSLAPEIQDALPKDFGFPIEDYTLRLVLRYNELIEKLHLHDNGLLDRVVEVVKLAIRSHMKEETVSNTTDDIQDNGFAGADQVGDLFFLGEDNNKYIFQTFTSEGQWQQLELDPSVYVQAYDMVGSNLVEEGSWDIVDNRFAVLFTQYVAKKLGNIS